MCSITQNDEGYIYILYLVYILLFCIGEYIDGSKHNITNVQHYKYDKG